MPPYLFMIRSSLARISLVTRYLDEFFVPSKEHLALFPPPDSHSPEKLSVESCTAPFSEASAIFERPPQIPGPRERYTSRGVARSVSVA